MCFCQRPKDAKVLRELSASRLRALDKNSVRSGKLVKMANFQPSRAAAKRMASSRLDSDQLIFPFLADRIETPRLLDSTYYSAVDKIG